MGLLPTDPEGFTYFSFAVYTPGYGDTRIRTAGGCTS